jgi:hypothetical protein
MVNEKLCTVCGYEMEEGPRDWNICPSCGTEFGLHDVNSTIDSLRTVWFAMGPRWHSSVVPQPANWNPFVQVAIVMSGGTSGSSIVFPENWSAQAFVVSFDIQHEEVPA